MFYNIGPGDIFVRNDVALQITQSVCPDKFFSGQSNIWEKDRRSSGLAPSLTRKNQHSLKNGKNSSLLFSSYSLYYKTFYSYNCCHISWELTITALTLVQPCPQILGQGGSEWLWKNARAFYDAAIVTAVHSFIVQAISLTYNPHNQYDTVWNSSQPYSQILDQTEKHVRDKHSSLFPQ